MDQPNKIKLQEFGSKHQFHKKVEDWTRQCLVFELIAQRANAVAFNPGSTLESPWGALNLKKKKAVEDLYPMSIKLKSLRVRTWYGCLKSPQLI